MARSSAVAGFGLILDLSVYRRSVEIPSCEHPERLGKQFCSACGKRVETHHRRETTDEWEEVVDLLNSGNLGVLSCYYINSFTGEMFLGWAWRASDYAVKLIDPLQLPKSADEVWQEIEELLKPWPELLRRKAFGFHVIMTSE